MTLRKRVTLQDIAASVGLSVNTVSRALGGKDAVSDQTRELVRAEADRLGYVPNSLARSLVLGSSMTIGLVITNPSNPFYATLISAIEQRGRSHGYSLLLVASEENIDNERRAVDLMLQSGVDGAIVVPVQTELEHWRRLGGAGSPVVFVNRDLPELGFDLVGIDYEQGAYDATSHLLESGARHVCLLEEDLEITPVTARLTGFLRAARDRQVADDAVQILRVPTRRHDARALPWEAAEAYQLARGVIPALPDRAGVLVGSDHFALGMYRALADAGRPVPAGVAVVGFGDHPFSAYLIPRLSSVRLPAAAVGAAAVDQLISRVKAADAGPARKQLFAPELVVRESSVRPGGSRAPQGAT
jgi:LacI family transcriptional regulator, galactose operon repressor